MRSPRVAEAAPADMVEVEGIREAMHLLLIMGMLQAVVTMLPGTVLACS